MDNPNPNDPNKPLGIEFGPIDDPIITECPKCHEEIVYLYPTNCQHCGTIISLKKGTQVNSTGDVH